jgi:hypothetical protein
MSKVRVVVLEVVSGYLTISGAARRTACPGNTSIDFSHAVSDEVTQLRPEIGAERRGLARR